METIIRINVNELSETGRWLIYAATGSNPHLARILRPRDGAIYATIADSDDSDDVVVVRVKDGLGWDERALRFGVEGRPGESDDYIAEKQRIYGDLLTRAAVREWEFPAQIVRQVRAGKLSGQAAWEAAAAEFVDWLGEGQFEVAISSDWVTQTEAASRLNLPLNTVRQAVARGGLSIWEDMMEKNPQRRTRVSWADAQRIWRA